MDRNDGRTVRIPDASHPITIERNPKRVVVTMGGHVIADTTRALVLREASYPPVQYIPREDAEMASFVPSTKQTHCPYKGDCSYLSINVDGERRTDAVWSYETPYESVAAIRGHLAFYPDRVAIEERAV